MSYMTSTNETTKQELRRRKHEFGQKVEALIEEFHSETGFWVTGISIDHHRRLANDGPLVDAVRVSGVEIEPI